MKLWHISQTEEDGYDSYDSAVVCAEDEAGARATHPDGRGPVADGRWNDWATKHENVVVRYLGEADPSVEPGVVCASFNAG